MSDFEFELEPLHDGRIANGYHGRVGKFGQVKVHSPFGGSRQDPLRQAILEGELFPETLFSGGHGVVPSLDGGWLKVDGTLVDMDLKVQGIRKGSRWLEMTYRDRRFSYTSFGPLKEAQLKRKGVTVTLDRGRYISKIGATRIGRVEGEADATDLAIAIVLEEVDRSALTTGGAIMAIPMNFLFGRGRDEGSG
ncbi:hypothetical protein GCM10010129_16360 [Streptomyces fumigatiscleroticus]|nr:hypothetical protein GCM10010129_16360 [Streptomyces fumigatiscleroticus]